ncbi:lipopolysaccharide assembly protein LapB [Fibrobacter sp. UWB12]|uniref:tetratricopeptide repeat protein n=1 Tax=Fibrobacter sp. UWB12 TaxID=1896203 RepID=UPI0020C87E8B|nr:tetratricopeptide repeat protein [Fibrobacter sp. UWB12]
MSQSWAVDPRIEQGARFEAKGQYDKALGEYRAMLAENKKNTEAYMAAGKVRMKMKDYKGAVANFRLAYGYDPSLTEAYEGAAKAYEAMGQQAKADAERAKMKGGKAAAKTETAKAETSAPKAEVAKAEPAKTQAPAKATQPAQQAAPAKTETPKAAQPAQVAATEDPFEKGKALLAEGRYAEAAPLWRTVLSKKPGDAGAYFYAGLTRYEMGEYDKAEFNLKKGLSYKERGNDANYYLAKINQKSKHLDLEKKYLSAYLKKAAPDAKFRKAAEDRMAEINAVANAAAEEKAMKEAEAKALKEAKKTGNDKARSVETAVSSQNNEVAPTATNSIANANALYADGYNEAALQMYKALLENEITPDERYFAMLQMGNIYREMRDFHSAVTRYRDVVREFPDSDWATEAERALEDAVWLEKHASELPRNKR